MMTPVPAVVRDRDTVGAGGCAGVRSLPVCGGGGWFLGTLSDRDILERCVAVGLDPRVTRAESLRNGDAVPIDPERPADDTVLAVLFVHPDGLHVVQDGLLVGMVGLSTSPPAHER